MADRPRSIPCFLLVPTEIGLLQLRRYRLTGGGEAPCAGSATGFHTATVDLERVPWTDEIAGVPINAHVPDIVRDDQRWPKTCAHCDYRFVDADPWQRFVSQLWKHKDKRDDHYTLRDAPAGAMWWGTWYRCDELAAGETCLYGWTNCDGNHLIVRLPGGHDWNIGSRARNCDQPTETTHRCWVMHGDPPAVTVDKNGHTCGAGGGSISVTGYHGFLRNGCLEEC